MSVVWCGWDGPLECIALMKVERNRERDREREGETVVMFVFMRWVVGCDIEAALFQWHFCNKVQYVVYYVFKNTIQVYKSNVKNWDVL